MNGCYVHSSTIYDSYNMEINVHKTEEWIKVWYIYTMEYYSAIKNEIMVPAATWMDLEMVIPREVSQTEKDKFHIFSCSVMSNSLRLHGLQHARLPCPSPTPGACSNSCPLSQ